MENSICIVFRPPWVPHIVQEFPGYTRTFSQRRDRFFFWSNAKSFPQRLDLLGPGGCRMSAISRFFMWNTWQLEWGRDGKYLLAKYGKFPDFDMVLRCFMKISPETQHGNAGLHQVFSDRSRLVRCLSASMSQVSRLGG